VTSNNASTSTSAPPFTGFPARAKSTAIPNVFFTDVLPQLAGDAVALTVTLAALHAISKRQGFPRYITTPEVASEPAVVALESQKVPTSYLSEGEAGGAEIPNELRRAFSGPASAGLARAVDLGVLLPLDVEQDGQRHTLYFLNTPADRRGLEAVSSGSVDIGVIAREQPPAPARSNIFVLYESLIGTISPLIAGELAEAERLYPTEWLEAAFREAAAQNARSWRYVSRILERWAIEGPDHETTERSAAGERYFRGKYGSILKQRLKS
jgi:DnaD/phage-associated family protein